jgi:hypothetical protein
MTERKDLKRLIRERMAKTGESYTTARMHLAGGEGESGAVGKEWFDNTIFVLAVDGRWSATDPDRRDCVGYGPNQYRAWNAMSNLRFELSLGRRTRPMNVLTLIEQSPTRWTARATVNLDVCAEGGSRAEAVHSLVRALGPAHERRPWADSEEEDFDRTVVFQKTASGTWSAEARPARGEGATLDEAEADMLDDEDAIYDFPDVDPEPD